MISVTRHQKHNIVRENEKLLNSLKKGTDNQAISLTYFEAKVVNTKEFDNNYSQLLDCSFVECKSLIDEAYKLGFSAWIFDRGPFLTLDKLKKIQNYSPFGNLKKQGLADAIHIQKCYKFPNGIKYAGLFALNRDLFHKGCVFIEGTMNALIIISKRNDLLSEDNLDRFFNNSAFQGSNVSFGTLDWATLCLEVCSQGDVVVNVEGGFDDLYRSICFYYCQNALSMSLWEIMTVE